MMNVVVTDSASSPDQDAVSITGINTTGCDLLVLVISAFTGVTDPLPTPTDNKSNTWTPILLVASSLSTVVVTMYYAKNPTVGTGHNFTFGFGGSQTFAAMALVGASGSDLTSPLINHSAGSNNGGGSTTCQGGVANPGSTNGCLFISGNTLVDAGFTAISIDDGFTLDQVIPTNGGFNQGIVESYFIQTTAGTLNPTVTFDNSGRAAMFTAVFQPAGTPPPSTSQSGLALLGVG